MNPKQSEVVAKVLTLQIDENPLANLIESCIRRYFEERPIPPSKKEYLSQDDTAKRFDISVPKFIELRKQGIVRGVQIGNKWRFEVSEVWEALQRHQEKQVEQFEAKRNGRA
ncbi:MAG: Helix-turn-helix domain [Bacteroidota bacterium]|jgi:hypothetical protein